MIRLSLLLVKPITVRPVATAMRMFSDDTKKQAHPFGRDEKNHFDFAAFEEKHRHEEQRKKAERKRK